MGHALLRALLVAAAAHGAAAAAGSPPSWSGEVGTSGVSQAQWGPFFARHINYQWNTTLTAANLGFNVLGVHFEQRPSSSELVRARQRACCCMN